MDIVERLRNFETTNVDLLFLKNDAALEIERLREVVMLLVAYDEHDKDTHKGEILWDVLIEAAHSALEEEK